MCNNPRLKMSGIQLIDTIRAALQKEMDRTGIAAKRLSREAGLSESAVRDLMGKVDDPRIGTLLKLASYLQIPPGQLFGQAVPVVGLVGVDGIIKFFEGESGETAPMPPTALGELIAIRVVGDALFPVHKNGDILYVSRSHDRIEPNCFGEECAVQLLDGRAYLKTLAEGSKPGCHHLRAFNAPDIENAQLAWAAPVLFVWRAFNGKNGQ